jgi:uncharacterized protein YkwD
MSTNNHFAFWPLTAAALTAVSIVVSPVPSQADGGCIPGDIAGQVPRNARPGDNVCVPPNVAATVQQENETAADRREPNGGAYGPLTCKSGWVWREAFDGDGVCVTPQRRQETWQQNANAGVGATGGLKPNVPKPPQTTGSDQGGAVLSLVNQQRAANGCGPLASNGQLTAAAARHAKDMATSGVELHTGSDGSTPESRISDAGYAFSKDGEIVYWGTGGGGTPQAAVNWWMNSPGHRAIITDCSFTDVGFATATNAAGKFNAVGDFGKPQ